MLPKQDLIDIYTSVVQIFWVYSTVHSGNKAEVLVKSLLRAAVKKSFDKFDNLTDVSFLAPGNEEAGKEFEAGDLVEVSEISALPTCESSNIIALFFKAQ